MVARGRAGQRLPAASLGAAAAVVRVLLAGTQRAPAGTQVAHAQPRRRAEAGGQDRRGQAAAAAVVQGGQEPSRRAVGRRPRQEGARSAATVAASEPDGAARRRQGGVQHQISGATTARPPGPGHLMGLGAGGNDVDAGATSLLILLKELQLQLLMMMLLLLTGGRRTLAAAATPIAATGRGHSTLSLLHDTRHDRLLFSFFPPRLRNAHDNKKITRQMGRRWTAAQEAPGPSTVTGFIILRSL